MAEFEIVTIPNSSEGTKQAIRDLTLTQLASSAPGLGASLIGVEDSGNFFPSNNLEQILAMIGRDRNTYVDDYGPIGTGDDAPTIQAASNAAGSNSCLVFTPGTEYVIRKQVSATGQIVNQKWLGYGAKLKRADGISTTVTSNGGTVSIGETSCVVANPSGFAPGIAVAFYNSASPAVHCTEVLITGVSGNTISFQAVNAVVANAVMITAHKMCWLNGRGNDLYGLEVNGNRGGGTNSVWARWDIHYDVALMAGGQTAQGCYVHDSVAEGIVVHGSDSLVQWNILEQLGGNAIHLTAPAANHIQVLSNIVKHCNLFDQTTVGHASGGIILSNQITDVQVIGNYVEGAIEVVGSIDSANNRQVIISGNIGVNCMGVCNIFPSETPAAPTSVVLAATDLTSVYENITLNHAGVTAALGHSPGSLINTKVYISGVPEAGYNGYFQVLAATADQLTLRRGNGHVALGSPASAPAVGDITVASMFSVPEGVTLTGNQFYNCGRLQIGTLTDSDDGAYRTKRVDVHGNILFNCTGWIGSADTVDLRGNQWFYDLDKYLAVDSESRQKPVVLVKNSQNITLDDTIQGGRVSLQVTGPYSKNVKVAGRYRNFNKYGVQIFGLQTSGKDTNVAVRGAMFSTDAQAADYLNPDWSCAIETCGGVTVMGNDIYMKYGNPQYKMAAVRHNGQSPDLPLLVAGNVFNSEDKLFFAMADATAVKAVVRDNYLGASTAGTVYLQAVTGGTGYLIGDVLTVVGGTGTAMQLTVKAVTGVVPNQAVYLVDVSDSGAYTALPANPVSVTGGTGTGATFNIFKVANNEVLP